MVNINEIGSKIGLNPIPFDEEKTTVSIGLGDSLCKLNKKSLIVLREPSL